MATNVTIVALSQMVDISLNSSEGILNFQALHTLLHVMIQQLSLHDVAVEFRGSDSDRIQALISTIKPDLKNTILGEYGIVPSNSKGPQKPKRKSTAPKKLSLHDVVKQKESVEEKKEKEIRVIERRKDSKEDPDLNPLPLKSPPGSLLGITPDELKTVVVVESHHTLPQYTVAMTKHTFDELQTDVTTVKEKLQQLLELPTNKDLIDATRSSVSPIVDTFHIVNLAKRMDANEISLQKLASLIEDIAKHAGDEIVEQIADIQTSINSPEASRRSSMGLTNRVAALEQAVHEIATKTSVSVSFTHPPLDSSAPPATDGDNRSVSVSVKTQESTKPAKEEQEQDQKSQKSQTKGEETRIQIWSPTGPFSSSLLNVNLENMDTQQAIKLMMDEFTNLNKWVTESIKEIDRSKIAGFTETSAELVELKVNEYAQQIQEINVSHTTQIEVLNENFLNVQTEITDILTKLETILPGGDSTGINAEMTMDLANKLVILEKEMITLAEHAEKLDEEKKERDKQTEVIMEELDVLKIVKANREDLEDALGEKADACVINRKVSHDQFDAACDDLTRGIEDALTRLEEQEDMWQHTLVAIQREVGNKLDKMEVDPLKDFVNSKLRALQEKFKSLTALKKEKEAAGTKNRLLRNVNCISCDKDVVMKTEMDVSMKPKPYGMPANRNMAPYLAYELDQLRKQQKCTPGGRNLNFIESALKTQGHQDKNHICNRYCGGSHTVTTPQQRVTRLGHFLDQWGPEIAPLEDEYIKGKDNHMYRSREESLYNKGTKRESQGTRTSKGGNQPSIAEAQPERDDMVSAVAQEAIMTEEHQKATNAVGNGKIHNIGSDPLNPQPELGEQRGSLVQEGPRGSQAQEGPRASQAQEGPRGSQAPGLRASQAQAGPRASQAQEGPRASQAQEGPRASQAQEGPRGSQAPILRASQAQAGPRASQAQEGPRASQAQEGPRASQAQEGPRGSQAPGLRASQAQAGPRASQAQEGPRASQAQEGPRASQAQEGPRASQAQEGPRPSQLPEGRTSRVKILDNRESQSSEAPSSKAGANGRASVQISEQR